MYRAIHYESNKNFQKDISENNLRDKKLPPEIITI